MSKLRQVVTWVAASAPVVALVTVAGAGVKL